MPKKKAIGNRTNNNISATSDEYIKQATKFYKKNRVLPLGDNFNLDELLKKENLSEEDRLYLTNYILMQIL